MFTFSCARAVTICLLAACIAVTTLSVMAATMTAADADGMALGGCVGTRGSLNCVVRWGEAGDPYVRTVPQPVDPVERAEAAKRDRAWEKRCQPVIAQDRYGVPRYVYAAPGCEFGVVE